MNQRKNKRRIMVMAQRRRGLPRCWVSIGYMANRPRSFSNFVLEVGRVEGFRFFQSPALSIE